jgi:chemosensory pili system protein ChpA (sensor histidine kinase/response regulator)
VGDTDQQMMSDTGIHEQKIGADAGSDHVAALAIVGDELMETIRNAQLALEDSVDGRGGTAALRRAGELLHQARGALRLTETYGAALLVEEMELACTHLAGVSTGTGRDDGLEALTRAMVQLPVYVDRIMAGGRDIALVLLPMLNDLRAARGEPLLSEGTLLLLNLSPNRRKSGGEEREGNGEDPVQVATRLRPKFQLALLGWIKGGESARHLANLSNIAKAMEDCATRDDMYQLWWVVGGVLESLQTDRLETSVALKRLLGQADRQLKYIIDEGLQSFERHPVDDLLNNLLYYVARSTSGGERIGEIRAAFNLAELLPGAEQVEQARDELSAPSAKLMQTVAAAIKDDLGRVKDVLDIFVRTGMNNASELVPQLELLKKIGDTLGVLGLGQLRGDVEGEIDRIKIVIERGGTANDQLILDIASTLLRVEDRLDQQLLRLTAPTSVPDTAAGAAPDDDDFRRVTESVMRECIINLARIKDTISESFTSRAPSQGVDSVPSLIRGIKAGLQMLEKTRAMEVVERVGRLVNVMLSSGGAKLLEQRETDRLADAIVSIEYYMETVKAGRSEPWYMLDNAEACLTVLQNLEQRLKDAHDDNRDETQQMAIDDIEAQALAAVAASSNLTNTQTMATEIISSPVMTPEIEHIDPELLEIFIEEAKEEVASMKRHLPAWAAAPDDMESLITIRRSFHTLKGSGRMVGAERIAEYSWAVENLLNRLINHTLQRTPPMVEFVLSAAAVVPELIEQLEVGTEPTADISLFIARANAFADGDPNASVLQLAITAAAKAPVQAAALEMDPVLYDIFCKETAGHLRVVFDYLQACEGHSPLFDVTDKLHRACHTLHGSANMANVERGVAVAAELNRFVRRVHDQKTGFDRAGLDALHDAAKAIQAIVDDINKPEAKRAEYGELIERLGALCNAVQSPAMVGDARDVEEPPATPSVEAVDPVVETVESEDEAVYDAEIAAIFTEESAELLEAADAALIDWSKTRSGTAMEELKRHLHTLKGGARMAGIAAMGDLSHELETLLISVDDGRIEATTQTEELLQRSIDELHRMRDTVIAGKPVRASLALVQQIYQANAGLSFADEAQAEPTDAERAANALTSEFTSAPEDIVSVVIVDVPPLVASDDAKVEAEKANEQLSELVTTAKTDSDVAPDAELTVDDDKPPEPQPILRVAPPAGSARDSRMSRAPETRPEFARVEAELLEDLLNAAGEISIYQSRLSQQVSTFDFHVEELEQTISRLREQLRKLEIETEAQIMHGHQETLVARDFDPLELDRYSHIQQLTRALAESASDLGSLKDLLQAVTTETDGLLVQQSRVTAELQDGLMRTRMVPFERYVGRLTRLVRQAASEADKLAELAVEGASGELDRQVLEKMLPPFEHMLRNAVVHGIETAAERQSANKAAVGRITIRLHREGAEMVIDVSDDGAGLNVEAIRRKAYELDLLQPDSKANDDEIMQLVLTPGFTTASSVTQSAGRGVGMDVVASEVKKLGGSLRISSVTGQGTNFAVRLPFTLAITQALIVRTGDEVYALPLPTVEGVARIPRKELESLLSESEPSYEYGEQSYKFRHLGMYLGGQAAQLPAEEAFISVILVRAGEFSAALLVDEMLASREIVVKSVGPQLASIRGISGATILGDGSIVLILDIHALVRTGAPVVDIRKAAPKPADARPVALVVDDSITVRRVTERFLQRNGLRCVTAKDGLDAISVMQDTRPDIILLDIEMPRMDGYEFASHVRNDKQVSDVPIIMITSRVGDKHRARAIELGVNDYLGKPYRDSVLLEAIRRQLEDKGIVLP